MTAVLIVVAHPDDAEIAMAMRIRSYAQNGADVRILCLTTGCFAGGDNEVRRQECRSAGALLGVRDYTFFHIPDTRFADHRGAIASELRRVIGDYRPDIIYTHYPKDQHTDHVVTGEEVTAVALREAANLTYFRSPYSLGFDPNEIFMGTADLLHVKELALGYFVSQRQLDMAGFLQLAQIAHRQYVHHRVLERLPPRATTAELFVIERRVEVAG